MKIFLFQVTHLQNSIRYLPRPRPFLYARQKKSLREKNASLFYSRNKNWPSKTPNQNVKLNRKMRDILQPIIPLVYQWYQCFYFNWSRYSTMENWLVPSKPLFELSEYYGRKRIISLVEINMWLSIKKSDKIPIGAPFEWYMFIKIHEWYAATSEQNLMNHFP